MRLPARSMLICMGLLAVSAAAEPLTVDVVKFTQSTHRTHAIGSVTFEDTPFGLLITPRLSALSPGIHGFHIHQHPACDDHGMAAAGHWDPDNSGAHNGPYASTGHLGDLPALVVDAHGHAHLPVLAPRLTVKSIQGHALMIHQDGDNYSDSPKALGGGGPRLACGIIPAA